MINGPRLLGIMREMKKRSGVGWGETSAADILLASIITLFIFHTLPHGKTNF